MMQRVKDHWESLGCTKGVLLHASACGRKLYQKVGFTEGEMLTFDLAANETIPVSLPEDVSISEESANDAVYDHLSLARSECSRCALPEEAREKTLNYLKHSQEHCQSTTFSARLPDGSIIGTVVSARWEGPLPLVLQPEVLQFGTAWGLFVKPEWRNKGIGSALMERCTAHWRKLGCQKGVVMCSDAGAGLLSKLGFEPGNALVLKLCGSTDSASAWTTGVLRHRLGEACGDRTDAQLQLLLNALPQQLRATAKQGCISDAVFEAVCAVQDEFGLVVREGDNWFERNLARFGAGFDMAALKAEPEELASKFDRLASKYDHWVVGNQSRVEGWLSQTCTARCSGERSAECVVADVACGVGLPGHTLRLCGFQVRRVSAWVE
eukprot:TRINITY_DN11660_c0_g1_i6.p1 TRINITY_DN11660_c0_g1~~TRINITY_DN11660_c0_g1_i6.p1  ORF type:complete len:381 (-),score=84.19 TRINITY_DN11660_c0_g1_i6:576-1718(-)